MGVPRADAGVHVIYCDLGTWSTACSSAHFFVRPTEEEYADGGKWSGVV